MIATYTFLPKYFTFLNWFISTLTLQEKYLNWQLKTLVTKMLLSHLESFFCSLRYLNFCFNFLVMQENNLKILDVTNQETNNYNTQIARYLKKFAFTFWDIWQYVYCNCLLLSLRRHKFWLWHLKLNLTFLSHRFPRWPKNSEQKFKYLENENSFLDEIKSIISAVA